MTMRPQDSIPRGYLPHRDGPKRKAVTSLSQNGHDVPILQFNVIPMGPIGPAVPLRPLGTTGRKVYAGL
jgi:hypothetical protein